MSDRQRTVVCTFDPNSPRISAYDIHEWIHDHLQVQEHALTMIQIDGTKRHVYLKFVDDKYVQDLLQSTDGRVEYRHENGEISIVRIEHAGMGMRRIRIANLPPGVPERTVRITLAPYGEIMSINDETWSKKYRYTVSNGVKVVMMKLTQHLPSHMTIAGNRILASYEGQPTTCYGCGKTGHIFQSCPLRQAERPRTDDHSSNTWARITAKNPLCKRDGDENREKLDLSHISNEHEEVNHPPTADEPNTNTSSITEENWNYRKGTRRRIPSNQGEEDHSSDTDKGSDHTQHDETETEMDTSAATSKENKVQPVFMSANGGEETHAEMAVDHGRAVERPTEETESQDERTDTPEPDEKMEILGKTQTRTKKMKWENGDEPPQDRKRNRTRASQLKKDKV